MGNLVFALNLRSKLAQFFVELFVPTIDVFDVADLGGAFGD